MDGVKVDKIIGGIKEKTKMTAYSLKIQKDSRPGIFDSKFGGVPYWDMEKEYPADKNGNKMMLLAQLNLNRAELDNRLPKQGMLQFFIVADDVFGLDFDEPDKQNTFKVVYHDNVDDTVIKEQVQSLNAPICTEPEFEEFSPIFHETAVEIVKTDVYMGDTDYRFEQLFRDIVKEKLGEDTKDVTPYNYFENEEYDKMVNELGNMEHWLMGYPYFTQADPREYEEKYMYYDTLLLQIDSEAIDGEDYVLWGDCGVANFFINHEDLEKKDFSKILYNWDCY